MLTNVQIHYLNGSRPDMVVELRRRNGLGRALVFIVVLLAFVLCGAAAFLAGVRLGTSGDYRDAVEDTAAWLGGDREVAPPFVEQLLAFDVRDDAGPLSRRGMANAIANTASSCESGIEEVKVGQTNALTTLKAQLIARIEGNAQKISGGIGSQQEALLHQARSLSELQGIVADTSYLTNLSVRSCILTYLQVQRLGAADAISNEEDF